MEQFWMVWTPNGLPPKYRHASRQAAQGEAMRLAGMNPGTEFFVLEAVGVAKPEKPKPPIVYEELLSDPPF